MRSSQTMRSDFEVAENADQTPEQRLMIAVLYEALVTFQRGLYSSAPEARKDYHEVVHWFRSSELDPPFSFESICTVLQIDPDYLRAGLSAMKRRVLDSRGSGKCRQIRRAAISSRTSWMGSVGS